MSYWDKKEKLSKYVGGVRQFFPLAEEQLDMISRIIEKFNPSINTFLDLGCGDGFLGYFIYELYPDAHGVFLDRSPEMVQRLKIKIQIKTPSLSYKILVILTGTDPSKLPGSLI